jgi:hypothetical protein
LITTDRHTPIQSEEADSILKQYIEDNRKSIKYFVDLGDGIDNPYMSDFSYDPWWKYNAQEEFDLYADHLGEIHNLIPRAKKILVAGNHDKGRLDNKRRLNTGMASLRNMEYENVLQEALLNAGAKLKKFELADKEHILELNKKDAITLMHGDPKLNPYIKGGVTGPRRTAENYPSKNDLIMGHSHRYIEYPRNYDGKLCIVLDGMYDIDKLKKQYINFHPYTNGFGIIDFDKHNRHWTHIQIKDGKSKIDGKLYKA